ncbi:MAG: acyl-CoA dehydrogenase [Candidatus Dadabacteria bacterium]|nr:MAG: acyl-CoA dehydrogenase [Candidatus Dadabacteria bacterium]
MTAKSENEITLIPDASVVKSLFLGNIIEENLFPYPSLSGEQAETLSMIIESVGRFMEGKTDDFTEYDLKGEQPEEYLNSLKELGLFGVIIPEEYEGFGLSNAAYSRLLQETSRYDGSTSLTIGAHSSIGMKGLLLFGTEEQKKRYLPRLASGELIAAFCLTEAGAGSDAASIRTAATKNNDGSWTLNGEKIWITNGGIAGLYTVFARTDSKGGKISAFIVEREWPGVSTGPKEDKMGIRASATNTVRFDNVRVPAENLLGEEGKGFKVAMSILNNGRTGLGGGCVGAMKRCIELASRQAAERKQFGRPIAEFGLIKEKIGLMTVKCFATESVVNMVAHYIDSGVKDYSVEAAISKVFATESLWFAANEALQVAGGNGYMREFPYERIVRDSRINMIFEGTNEILRLFIALSGMKVAGEYLKEIGSSAAGIFNDPIKGFGVLSGYASKKFTQLTTIGRDRLALVHESLRNEATVYEQYTLEFSKEVEGLLRKYGKNIIGRQFASKRIAEVVIDLFVGLCVLSRVSSMIDESSVDDCKYERAIAKIFTQRAKRRMNQKLRRIDKNEDKEVEELARYIVELGKYNWDVIKN